MNLKKNVMTGIGIYQLGLIGLSFFGLMKHEFVFAGLVLIALTICFFIGEYMIINYKKRDLELM